MSVAFVPRRHELCRDQLLAEFQTNLNQQNLQMKIQNARGIIRRSIILIFAFVLIPQILLPSSSSYQIEPLSAGSLNLSFASPRLMKDVAMALRSWKQEYSASRSSSYSNSKSSLELQLFSWIKPNHNPHWTGVADMHKSYSGKGIVVCASDKHLVMTLAMIESIRTIHRCDLPVEIFYNGDDDLSKKSRNLLETKFSDVKTVDISKIFDMEQLNIWGFAIKPFALLASSFRIAILVDADVTFLQSPSKISESQIFKSRGALFFKDRTLPQEPYMKDVISTMRKNLFFDGITQEPNKLVDRKSQHMQESGIVLIDKKERIAGLLATCLLNLGSIRETTYKNTYGDKETFWMGFEIALERYGFNPSNPGSISSTVIDSSKICSIQLLHVDEYSQPSWINGGLFRNKNLDDYRLVSPNYWAVEPGTWDFSIGHMACIIPANSQGINKLSPTIQTTISRTSEIFTKHQDLIKELSKLPAKNSKWSYDNIACENSVFDDQNMLDKDRFDHVARSISDYDALKYRQVLLSFTKSLTNSAHQLLKGNRGILFYLSSKGRSEELLNTLQNTRSELPIEIWCSQKDCLKSKLKEVNGFKASVHYLSPSTKSPPSVFTALLESSLDEVLIMDMNSKQFPQPLDLFDLESYKDTGLLFWKSEFKTRPDSPIWRILNMVCVDESIPSPSQFLIRKSSPGMLASIHLARFMEGGLYESFLASPVDMLRFAARSVGAPFSVKTNNQ